MKKNTFVTSLVMLVLAAALLCTATYAWFYFPSSKKLVIQTAPELPVETTLYHLETGNNGTLQFVRVAQKTAGETEKFGNTDDFSIEKDVSFFQWGEEYLCESEIDDYYALEIVLDADARNGYYSLSLDSGISCFSRLGAEDAETHETLYQTVTYKNDSGDTVILRFPLTTTGYAFAKESNVDLTSQEAVKEAQQAEYTPITYQGTDSQDSESFDLTADPVETDLKDLDSQTYVSGKNTVRMVVYFRVSVNTEAVNENMPLDINVFGDLLEVNVWNVLNLNATMRSIPQKTE